MKSGSQYRPRTYQAGLCPVSALALLGTSFAAQADGLCPKLETQAKAREVITRQWDTVAGANIQ